MSISQPKQKGEISELKVTTALVAAGYEVSKPFGDNLRYDLLVLIDNEIRKVQVKTGKLVGGKTISFANRSTRLNTKGYKYKHYEGEVDFFGVYCNDLDKCYLVPISCCNKHATRLRVSREDNRKNQFEVQYAEDFEITPLPWE